MTVATDALTADGRALTAELLALRGQQIMLTPVGTATEKPGGGIDYGAATPRDPQTFAKFNTKGFDGRESAQTDQGLVRKFEFDLIGAHDAIMAVGDTWQDEQAKYIVETVDHTMPYQVKATVTAYLKVTGHGVR